MLGMRLFLAGLVLIAIIATFYATPKILSLQYNLTLHGVGSPLDQGPRGHSIIYEALRRTGYRVSLSLDDALNGSPRSIVVAALGPTSCSYDKLRHLATRLATVSEETGARTALIVTGLSCSRYALSLLGLTYNPSHYPGAVLVYDIRGRAAFAAKDVTILTGLRERGSRVTPRFIVIAPRDVVDPYLRTGRGLPIAGVEAVSSRLAIVVIPADEVFQNEIIEAAQKVGINNLGYALRLVGELAGSKPSDTVVVFPSSLYRPRVSPVLAAVKLHPAMITLEFLKGLRGIEDSVLGAIMANPLALLVSLAGVSLLAFAFMAKSIRPGAAPPEDPEKYIPGETSRVIGASGTLETLLRRGTMLTKWEAREAIKALYEALDDVLSHRLGAGIEKVLEDPFLLRGLEWRNPGDYERSLEALLRLYTIYNRKIKESHIFPLILSWNKEIKNIILGVEPLLEALGAGLLEERGLERVLLS